MHVATLWRIVVRKQLDLPSGPSGGTEYSLEGACRTCGTGASQSGPLRLRLRKAPPTEIFLTLDFDIVLSARVADALGQAQVRCLGPVLAARNGAPLPLVQLVPQGTLPPFEQATSGFLRERPCVACGRDGYFDSVKRTAEISYDSVPSSTLGLDLLATYERFGNSRLRPRMTESCFAPPLKIVSPRLRAALESLHLPAVEFERVVVESVD